MAPLEDKSDEAHSCIHFWLKRMQQSASHSAKHPPTPTAGRELTAAPPETPLTPGSGFHPSQVLAAGGHVFIFNSSKYGYFYFQ